MTAVLAAPELRPGGAVFAVREGKNHIGAGGDNEIRLDDDPQVSSEHALLLCRGDVFHLADRMSSNGTAVNGVDLEGTHSTILEDRDRIRCGATELLFLRVALEGGAATGNDQAEDGGPSPAESA